MGDLSQIVTVPNVIVLAVTIYSICLHEAAHAFMADAYGDPTPRMLGKRTLDPAPHVKSDPWMTFVIPVITWFYYSGKVFIPPHYMGTFAIGGGRCPVSQSHIRRHRWGDFWVSFAGPLANFAVLLLILPLYFLAPAGEFERTALNIIFIELAICFFNLLPIPPMDGSYMLSCVFRPLRPMMDTLGSQFGMILVVIVGWSLMDHYGWPLIDECMIGLSEIKARIRG